jgi:hypothetical protein
MEINAVEGTKVKCINHSEDAAKWGSNDNPSGVLEVGKEYTVDHTEVHSWHTKVYLKEFPGKKFNSAHFE